MGDPHPGRARAAFLGVVGASGEETTYRASVTFFISTTGDSSVGAAVQGDQFAQRRVNSYVGLATTDRLAGMVAADLDDGSSSDQVKAMISASGDLETVLLTVRVESTDEDEAQAVAESVAVKFVELVDEVESPGEGPASVSLEVVSGPTVAALPPAAGCQSRCGRR